jgi:hypothetical protein
LYKKVGFLNKKIVVILKNKLKKNMPFIEIVVRYIFICKINKKQVFIKKNLF